MTESLGEAVLKLVVDGKEYTYSLQNAKGEAERFDTSTKDTGKSQQKQIDKLTAAYEGVVIAITAAIAFSSELLTAWGEAEAAATRLTAAVKIVHGAYEGMSVRLNAYADNLQRTSGFEDEQIKTLMAQAVTLGRTEDQVTQIADAATNLANAGIMPLDAAFTQLNLSFEGSVRQLGRMFPELKNLTEEELSNGKAVDIIAKNVTGMNDAMMKTTQGGLKSFKNSIRELFEAMGQALAVTAGPLLKLLGDVIDKVTGFINNTMEGGKAQLAFANGTATLQQKLIVYTEGLKQVNKEMSDIDQNYKDGLVLTAQEVQRYQVLSARAKQYAADIKFLNAELAKTPKPKAGPAARTADPNQTTSLDDMVAGYKAIHRAARDAADQAERVNAANAALALQTSQTTREQADAKQAELDAQERVNKATEDAQANTEDLNQRTANLAGTMQTVGDAAYNFVSSLASGDAAGAIKGLINQVLPLLETWALTAAAKEFVIGDIPGGLMWLGVAAAVMAGQLLINLALPEEKAPGYAAGGSFTVPPGYPDDSYYARFSSGERVDVARAGGGGDGGEPLHVTINFDGRIIYDGITQAARDRRVLIDVGAVV